MFVYVTVYYHSSVLSRKLKTIYINSLKTLKDLLMYIICMMEHDVIHKNYVTLHSSAEEQRSVTPYVVGSNPTGAIYILKMLKFGLSSGLFSMILKN